MAKEKLYTLKLTAKELWELKCNFDLSFQGGGEGNEVADRVSLKIHEVWLKVPAHG